MRSFCLAFALVVAACARAEDPAPRVSTPAASAAQSVASNALFAETPSLEEALAFGDIPTAPPQSWRFRQNAHTGGDYIAMLDTERPVSHHFYPYERRRSGNWIADVWRRGDGTQEEISYFNVATGASVGVTRDAAGQIRVVEITQASDYRHNSLEPTEEHDVHLGENCTIWRALPRPPGAQTLRESCVTDDGVELWSQARHTGHPTRPAYTSDRVEISSLSRRNVDPALARPPREILNWAYWRARAADAAQEVSRDTPPDHSVWFEDQREAEYGRVILAQYRRNARATLTRTWYLQGNHYDYALHMPGLRAEARIEAGLNTRRELRISFSDGPRGWRPDPAHYERNPTPHLILGRRCYTHTLRNPPDHGGGSDCWTNDNLVLARTHGGRGGPSGETAVRLEMGAPPAPLAPPPELFAWARAVTAD